MICSISNIKIFSNNFIPTMKIENNMIKNKIIRIEKKKLLLVEGKDEENFFNALLNKHNMQDIQVMSSGGKDQFRTMFPRIKIMPEFDNLDSLAIIQDADTNAYGRFQSICSTLKSSKLKAPQHIEKFTDSVPKIGVFIISDMENKGSLENLCLSTVENSQKIIKECIDPFMNCMDKKSNYGKPKNINKARLRAFLSAVEEDTPSLGIAAQKGYWNLSSDKLNSLVSFLKKI